MGSFGKNRRKLPVGNGPVERRSAGELALAQPMANPGWPTPVGSRPAQKTTTKKKLRLLRSLLWNFQAGETRPGTAPSDSTVAIPDLTMQILACNFFLSPENCGKTRIFARASSLDTWEAWSPHGEGEEARSGRRQSKKFSHGFPAVQRPRWKKDAGPQLATAGQARSFFGWGPLRKQAPPIKRMRSGKFSTEGG